MHCDCNPLAIGQNGHALRHAKLSVPPVPQHRPTPSPAVRVPVPASPVPIPAARTRRRLTTIPAILPTLLQSGIPPQFHHNHGIQPQLAHRTAGVYRTRRAIIRPRSPLALHGPETIIRLYQPTSNPTTRITEPIGQPSHNPKKPNTIDPQSMHISRQNNRPTDNRTTQFRPHCTPSNHTFTYLHIS